ncbi:class I SAM-dependent methyltransferase [Cytobacillus oceanisediminis]|uniref:class I SAM-dependent methyltransferase n=1 Tax=Cytobacillus oceanisediminis TaxID=665099 RepID=UPI002041DA51|nr:class I SAM-dependent methyltransferase [Cytobacillus oceanisediminis]MCM3400973.1 class I SAM-dependent methyltransferase [Cytobacillus oceanisediminis]
MSRLDLIRKEEKKYHDFCYENYKLFEEGSWLYKPVKTVMDLLPLFKDKKDTRVLDLGSGVGRNSIPIAEQIKNNNGKVVCVDLLSSAIEKLHRYSKEYSVGEVIELVKADIENYQIQKDEYDFIVAVSSLEHVSSEAIFEKVVKQMALGTKTDGLNCIIVNSDVQEIDLDTNETIDALIEINISSVEMIKKLEDIYDGWEVINKWVKPLKYKIVRNDREILLKTNAITYVTRKII